MANIQIVGNLTADPEEKKTNGGKPFWVFTVIENYVTSDGEEISSAIRVVSYKPVSLSKGDFVEVNGLLGLNTWTKKGGLEAVTEITATIFATGKSEARKIERKKDQEES